jgi:hypothetical protein
MLPLIPLLLVMLPPPDSAETCGRCHRAIHDAWKSSVHAHSMEDRVFQDSLELAEGEFGAGARRVCLSCHAPVAARIGDLALARKVSWEGVTCDYCHSIRDVSLDGPNPRAKVEFSLVKSGPLKDAVSNSHGTAYSAIHSSSLACAGCHEYANALGFPVLTTYSEWKASAAAREGKTCQSCHMYSVAGHVVDPRIQRTGEAQVNLHQMPGSHSIDQLNRTIAAALTASREGNQLKVTVEVSNRASGHSVPTGSALRGIRLEVDADSYDGRRFVDERVYRRIVADQDGNVIEGEHAAMWKAARVVSDTRLRAGEKRAEVFVFPAPPGVQAQVKATFWYFYAPMARREPPTQVTFLTLQKLVR